MQKYISKLLEEFQEQKPLYEEYCYYVYLRLNDLLKRRKYKYHILYRVKEIEKLEEKLARKKREGRVYKKLRDIEDLAGLRVIFYLESDRDRFLDDLREEIKNKNFVIKNSKKRSGYEAVHVIAAFSFNELSPAADKRFAGLKCEIQLTSILNHAWAEIEHDLVYKDVNGFRKSDRIRFEETRNGMQKIFTEYIKKAAVGLEKIARRI